jgi:hypothetical protein
MGDIPEKTRLKTRDSKQTPTIAPSMEMDELEVDASPKEIKDGESTTVTKLVIDRFD